MPTIKDLQNKKIAFLGLGVENHALVSYFLKHKIKCQITICDAMERVAFKNNIFLNKNIVWQLGDSFNRDLDKFDWLFRSPGWPINCPGIKRAIKAGAKLSSPMKLFFQLCPSKKIIGVTGTKGKGTTSSLIYHILKSAGKRVWLGGNIGVAPFAFIDKIKKNDWIVLELSSFQLEDLTASPQIAVITNFTPEHLAPADPHNPNFHVSLKKYWLAKSNIFAWQKTGDYIISNDQFPISKQIQKYKLQKTKKIISRTINFKKSELPSKLIGDHNKENIAAAVEVAKIVGVRPRLIARGVAGFKGLEHRLELVRELYGVKYYDDSFATTPESTIIALKSFSCPIVLLLGGADKGSDYRLLAKQVKKIVKYVVLLNGEATPRIRKELLKVGFSHSSMRLAYNIVEAVKLAKQKSRLGGIVLLSTACASFGMFSNYKERGRLFKQAVSGLK